MYPILPDCVRGNRIRLTRIFRLSIIRYSFAFERQTVDGSRPSRTDTAVLTSALLDKATESIARDPAGALFMLFVWRLVRRGRRVGIGARRPRGRLIGSRLWRMLSNVHVALGFSLLPAIRVPARASPRSARGVCSKGSGRIDHLSNWPSFLTSAHRQIYKAEARSGCKHLSRPGFS